ncbi:ALP1-like protein, partial [Tanacetum coccineum]
RQFNCCLLAILKLHDELLQKPQPITDACEDNRWKSFKGCLGALDGTSIRVTPSSDQKPRYRTRKADIATNVLGVCCPNMQFIYVLSGWQGSTHDSRVLRDAISRPDGLKIPQGCYYLVDAEYCNAPGFLTPFRGQRYHLNEFHGHRPQSVAEYFNMKHSKARNARNVIERCFGLLKGRWKILASPFFFPITTQVHIILACCLLHNLIRRYMRVDPQELEQDEEDEIEHEEQLVEEACLSHIILTDEWYNFRDGLAHQMFNTWRETSNP